MLVLGSKFQMTRYIAPKSNSHLFAILEPGGVIEPLEFTRVVEHVFRELKIVEKGV